MATFPKIFNGLFVPIEHINVHAKFEVRIALPVPEIIAIEVLGGVRTPNLGEGEAVGGRGWYRSKEPYSKFL